MTGPEQTPQATPTPETSTATDHQTAAGHQDGGLPRDIGNELSDRSGYTDDSASGQTDTAIGGGVPTGSDLPENVNDPDGSGTTFDGGSAVPGR